MIADSHLSNSKVCWINMRKKLEITITTYVSLSSSFC